MRARGSRPGVFPAAVALAATVVVGGAACGPAGPRPPAAVVSGAEIPTAELERLTDAWVDSAARRRLDEAGPEVDIGAGQSAKHVLTLLIRAAFLDRLAAELGVDAPPQPLEEAAAGELPAGELAALGWSADDVTEVLRNARLSRAIATEVFPEVVVSDLEVRRYYDGHAHLFEGTWQAEVRVAYFDTAGPAGDLAGRVRAGEAFEAAAERLGARESGRLGAVTPAAPLPPPVLAAVAGLPAGGVSEPVPGGGGYLVLMAETREEDATVTFEAAREGIVALLSDQKRQRLFLRWFDKRLRAAEVVVDGHYGRWDPDSLLVL